MAALAGIDTASKSITLIAHYGNHRITTTSTSVSYAHAHQKDREGSRLSKLSNWNSTSQRGMRRASISWSGCWQLSKHQPGSRGSTNHRPTVPIHTGRKPYTSFDSCQVSSREWVSRCYCNATSKPVAKHYLPLRSRWHRLPGTREGPQGHASNIPSTACS